ncbi:MAG: heme ABC transporter permease [Alphaproteobacteria bacterium]|nr:heme ABC transporter permease [Alphaproteobacteria bacterium]
MTPSFHRLANPARFQKFARRALPWSWAVAVLAIGSGFVWGLALSPADYQQGDTVRVMYVHVPAAWMAMACYGLMALLSAFFLVWKHQLAGIAALAAAPVGACFTAIALITGSLWGKPTWGTWWVWDARLTSVLVLFFLYLGYLALAGAFDDRSRGLRAASLLALVGIINLPIIKFSVDWWNTLHQPASILRAGGPSIHASMLWPLMITALGFAAFLVAILLVRIRSELALWRTEALMRRHTRGAP